MRSIVEKWLKRKAHSATAKAIVGFQAEFKGLSSNLPGVALTFNQGAFLERMMGDVEFAREVAAEFAKDLPKLVIELKESVALGAIEPIGKHAHKIKGSAGNVGGDALRNVAFEMEEAGKAGDLGRMIRLIPALENQAVQLIEALRQWTT
jgi:HPt (histidine-containing phosphotransfer) domain-containing protein